MGHANVNHILYLSFYLKLRRTRRRLYVFVCTMHALVYDCFLYLPVGGIEQLCTSCLFLGDIVSLEREFFTRYYGKDGCLSFGLYPHDLCFDIFSLHYSASIWKIATYFQGKRMEGYDEVYPVCHSPVCRFSSCQIVGYGILLLLLLFSLSRFQWYSSFVWRFES